MQTKPTVKQDSQDVQETQDTQRETSRDIAVHAEVNTAYQLALPQFLVWAYRNYTSFWDGEEWQSPLWSFTRLVKGHPQMIGLRADEALRVVEKAIGGWFGRKGDAWNAYFEIEAEDAQVEFLSCWERVRFVPGWEPLEQAIEQAKKMQLIPANKRTLGYQMFVSIAGWLQVTMGDRNIMLPCDKLSGYLKCKPMTISRYRTWAVEEGLLRIVKEHRFRSGGGGEATEFRFETSRYDCLARCAED
jgi:hypothetical protein